MPIQIGDFFYDYADPNLLKTPQLTGKPRPSYPIEGNSDIYILEEDYMQFIDYYKPLKPASRDPKRSNMFWIKDSPIADVGNGVGRFTRTWSVLPGASDKGYTRSEYESYAFTVPGIVTTQTGFYQFPVAAGNWSIGGTYTTITATVGGATATSNAFDDLDIETGKPAAIHYFVTDPLNGQESLRVVIKKAISVSLPATLVIENISDIGPIRIIGVQRADVRQDAYTKQIMSRLDYTYFIEGVNCTNIDSIPIIEELSIHDQVTGGRVEYLSQTTIPSLDDWMEKVANKSWIVVEPSVVRPWQGAIYHRVTRYVRCTM